MKGGRLAFREQQPFGEGFVHCVAIAVGICFSVGDGFRTHVRHSIEERLLGSVCSVFWCAAA